MTFLANTRRNSYESDGTEPSFSYTFRVDDETEIGFFVNGIETAYSTVTGLGSNAGGEVNVLSTLNLGDEVVIVGRTPTDQNVDYTAYLNFPAELHEKHLDRTRMRVQELADEVNRCVRLPLTDARNGAGFTIGPTNASTPQYMVLDIDGTLSLVTSAIDTTTPLSEAVVKAVLPDYFPQHTGVAAMAAASHTVGSLVSTAGYLTPGDGGGASYVVVADGTYTDGVDDHTEGGSFVQGVGIQFKLAETVPNVRQFGATGNGTTDDATAINNAVKGVFPAVYIPKGTYRCDSTINCKAGVSIDADGPEVSVLDFSQTVYANLTAGKLFVSGATTWEAQPTLAGDVTLKDTDLSFVSAPTLLAKEFLCVFDATTSSYSPFRTYYHAGEFNTVRSVSGNDVELVNSTYAPYTAGSVIVYRATNANTCELKNFRVRGLADTSNQVYGIEVNQGFNMTMENIVTDDASCSGIRLNQCYGLELNNCRAADDLSSDFGLDYGLAINNCQNLRINGGAYKGGRHGIAIGGDNPIGSVVNRNITIMGSDIVSMRDSWAADCHGNCEYITYTKCMIDGGIVFGGDHITIHDNTIRGKLVSTKTAVYAAEWYGCNHEITKNRILVDSKTPAANGAFISISGQNDALSSNTQRGGDIVISGNRMKYEGPVANDGTYDLDYGIYANNRGYAGGEDVNLVITKNKMTGNSNLTRIEHAIACGIFGASQQFNTITIENNPLLQGGLNIVDNGAKVADSINVVNNKFSRGYRVLIGAGAYTVNFNDNVIKDMEDYSGVVGLSGDKIEVLSIRNNEFINCIWGFSDSTRQSPLLVWRAEFARVDRNTTQGTWKHLQVQGDATQFDIGEIVEQDSNPTITAKVFGYSGSLLFVRDTAGAFGTNEAITGQDSATNDTTHATTPLPDARSLAIDFNDIDLLYTERNYDVDGKVEDRTSITSENP